VNETSASRADRAFDSAGPAPANTGRATGKVLVWDAPVRVFHWLMVASFAGAWLTAESERWRLLHLTLGYTMAGLVVFRIVWGLVGTRHARFSSFVRGPAAVLRHLGGLVQGRIDAEPDAGHPSGPEHSVGHNPAGAVAILGLLALTLVIAASGWATINDLGGEWLAEAHEFAAEAMLALVALHLGGVVLGSWQQRENLVGAMFSGYKTGRPEDGVRKAWRGLAALMAVAVFGFWAWQWQATPVGGLNATSATATQGDED
jgi:cytochrome b